MSISAETQQRLKPDNPRQLKGQRYKKLHGDLTKYGDVSGVVYNVRTGATIAGNQRSVVFDIAKCKFEFTHENAEPDEQGTLKLGYVIWKGKRYNYREVSWSKAEEDAACLIANIGAGEWDWDRLAAYDAEILSIAGMDADMIKTLENDERNLRAMLEAASEQAGEADAEPQIDRAAELNEKWGVKPGDLWAIGDHRLLCGDSTRAEDVGRVMGGGKIALGIHDPPYGINVVGNIRASIGGAKEVTAGKHRSDNPYAFGGKKNTPANSGGRGVVNATLYKPVDGDDRPFDPAHLIGLSKNTIIWGGNYFASKLKDSRCWLVWDKNNTGNFADCELAWTDFEKSVKMYKHTWNGLVREGERRLEGEKRMHPTQKPVGLYSQILGDYTEVGDIVLDCYAGVGVTMLACENTGRVSLLIEKDAEYVALVLDRMERAFPTLAIRRVEYHERRCNTERANGKAQ